jgi:hypothetical protein
VDYLTWTPLADEAVYSVHTISIHTRIRAAFIDVHFTVWSGISIITQTFIVVHHILALAVLARIR